MSMTRSERSGWQAGRGEAAWGRAALAGLVGLTLLWARLRAAGAADTAADAAAPPAVLIHLPGIAGEMAIDRDLVRGLVAGGVAPAATIIDWTGPDRGLPALTNVDRHHAQAKRVADAIVAIIKADARTPVILVGHSAGTGVAVEALEGLPPGVHVTMLVLLASALSPGYDLSAALRHVDGHAFSFWSPYDDAVLGLGTRAFGTYDRVRTDAAGYVGFTPPANADAKAYAKLTQVKYDPAWTRLGNGGDHIGPTNGRFARTILAPLIEGKPLPTTWPSH